MGTPSTNRPLTPRDQRFVAGYVLHGNGAKAAIDAGVPRAGAKVWACRSLRKVVIQQAIANQRASFANPLVNPAHTDPTKIADAMERRERLTTLFRAETTALGAARLADVLNRMDGLYVTKLGLPGAHGGLAAPRRVIIELDDASTNA